MKNLVLPVSLLVILFSACAEKEAKRIDMNQVSQFQDSIPHLIPGVSSIHTLQNDATKVTIIVGTPSFYTASGDKKEQAAIRTGLMILHVLGADNSLTEATLVISKKDPDTDKVPDDGIKIDMKIDSLKKVLFPKQP